MRVALLAVVAALALGGAVVTGQGRGRGGGAAAQPAQTPRAAALQDLTGTWVSVVTQHWHYRMQIPPKGDFAMVPVNAAARKVAAAFDPAKEGAADQCKSYGAAQIMRVPGRLNIRWADDATLQIDTDAGTQTRMLHFGGAPATPPAPSLQGYSLAAWEDPRRGRGGVTTRGADGMLKVTTTRMSAGYLRRNGVPYSEDATLVEFFDAFTEPNGDRWLNVTTIVTDPQYLTGPYVTTNSFKKIPDRQGWDPTPCRATEPR
jgi:hypothetical protein